MDLERKEIRVMTSLMEIIAKILPTCINLVGQLKVLFIGLNKTMMIFVLKNGFSPYSVCLSTRDLRKAPALDKKEFSRGHS